MIHAYNEIYLDTVMKNLAGMFDLGINIKLANADTFADAFSHSKVASGIEHGHPNMLAGKSPSELLSIVLGEDTACCSISMNRSPEYWAGWILAMAQWELSIPFNKLFQSVPFSTIISMYSPYHESDESKAIEEIKKRIPKTGTRLKELRIKNNLTQQQLSILSGINLRTIRSYEQSTNELARAQGETLFSLSKELGCTVDELLIV